MSRTETPELRDLADKYQGALVIFLGDVSKEEDNKVTHTWTGHLVPERAFGS